MAEVSLSLNWLVFSFFPSSPFSLPPVPVQFAEQQHGSEHRQQSSLHQPLQLRAHLQCPNALALLAAQLYLRHHVPGPRHPLQHRLPWSPPLRGDLPAVQHRQVSHLDSKLRSSTLAGEMLSTAERVLTANTRGGGAGEAGTGQLRDAAATKGDFTGTGGGPGKESVLETSVLPFQGVSSKGV